MAWDIEISQEIQPPDGSPCQDCGDAIYGEKHVTITKVVEWFTGRLAICDENPEGEWVLCKDCRQKWDDFNKRINKRTPEQERQVRINRELNKKNGRWNNDKS